jgi:hypothetical protein
MEVLYVLYSKPNRSSLIYVPISTNYFWSNMKREKLAVYPNKLRKVCEQNTSAKVAW